MPIFQNTDISSLDRVYVFRDDDTLDEVDVTTCDDVTISQQGDTYIFTYTNPTDQWCINHGLSKYPDVFLVDDSGNQLLADIQHINSSYIIVYFNGDYSGKAYIN